MSIEGGAVAREMAREVARAEVQALTGAMMDAFGATLAASDLSADAIGASLRDVVDVFSGEIDRRVPGWVSPGEARIDADPEAPTVPTVPTEEANMNLSDQDKAAVVLAKAGRGNPELRERIRKTDEARAAREPVSKLHPVSKMSEDSPALSEFEPEILAKMSSANVSAEVAVGLLCKDPSFHVMKTRYKEEMRARGA